MDNELNFFETVWEQIKGYALTSGVRLVGALLLVVLGFKFVNFLCKRLASAHSLRHADVSAQRFICSFISVALKVVLALTAAAMIGIPMTNVVAIIGSCGLAVGLALQGSLSNFAGGIMLIIFKPFKVGDTVIAQGSEGVVTDISILYTRMLTADNKQVVIPNGTLSNATVINCSAEPLRRADVEVTVPADRDMGTVVQLLTDIGRECEYRRGEREPEIGMLKSDSSSAVFTLRVWVDTQDYYQAGFALRSSIDSVFRQHGIFPAPRS